MHQIVQNYSNKYCYLSGVNNFWAVEAVITSIKSLNKQGKNESIMALDSSCLCTKILDSVK